MASPYAQFSTRRTPQSEPILGSSQVPNSAGGHAWHVDDFTRLHRFLVLGSEGGTYYAGEQKLTRENAQAVVRCVAQDGPRTVREIVAVSAAGRAPKNDPAIFALAIAAGLGDDKTRRAALDALPEVCRIGTHLFHFAEYVEQFRGWGRGLRRAVGAWYTAKDVDALAYQLVKYQQRDGWSHRDLLRLSKPRPERGSMTDHALCWAVGKLPPAHELIPDADDEALPDSIAAYIAAQEATTPAQIVNLIATYAAKLPREAIPSQHLTADVWAALLDAGMPMTALIRNLATMTRCGLIAPMSTATAQVVAQLGDGEYLRKARVHPLGVLVALNTYASGRSARGIGEWQAVPEIVDALDDAFYASFGNVEATNQRTLLALDLSGSMGMSEVAGMPGITPRVAAAALALVTAAVEPHTHIVGFTGDGAGAWQSPNGSPYPDGVYTNVTAPGLCPLTLSPRQLLDDACRTIAAERFGPTDCAIPMLYALDRKMSIDTFIVYTDSETWAGAMHPAQALARYREKTGIAAKLVVVAMVSNGFTIADPNDPGMLDVVGFDSATPAAISAFVR